MKRGKPTNWKHYLTAGGTELLAHAIDMQNKYRASARKWMRQKDKIINRAIVRCRRGREPLKPAKP